MTSSHLDAEAGGYPYVMRGKQIMAVDSMRRTPSSRSLPRLAGPCNQRSTSHSTIASLLAGIGSRS